MRSLPVGAFVAAIVMFALGFVFFGLLGMLLYAPLDPATATALQGAVAQHLTATGSYMVPAGEAAWVAGPSAVINFVAEGDAPDMAMAKPMPIAIAMSGASPSAVINFVAEGDAPDMAMAMGMGFVHFLLTALLIGYGLVAAGGDFARQARLVLWFGLAAAVFGHLGDPIWYGFAWRTPLIEFVFDAIIFIAGGLVLAKWFTSARPATE